VKTVKNNAVKVKVIKNSGMKVKVIFISDTGQFDMKEFKLSLHRLVFLTLHI